MNDKIEVNNGSKSKWINPLSLAAYRNSGYAAVNKTAVMPVKSQPKPLNLLKVYFRLI